MKIAEPAINRTLEPLSELDRNQLYIINQFRWCWEGVFDSNLPVDISPYASVASLASAFPKSRFAPNFSKNSDAFINCCRDSSGEVFAMASQ